MIRWIVRLWYALAVFNLLIAISHAVAGEWHSAFTSFIFAWLDAYIGHLEADRERYAKVFRLVWGGDA